MALYDFLQVLLDVNDTIASATECIPVDPKNASACPASVFHAVTAAFATQGYWVQADMLHLINNTGFHTWAILIYTIAAISGIISMAMGFPPKLYLWFFMGPGIFHWLVQDTVPVMGVRWNVGPNTPDDLDRQRRAQREVWKLAEVGISNTNALRSGNGIDFSVTINASELGEGLSFGEKFGKVRVANLFVWYDLLVTNIVEWFVQWSGVFYMASSEASIFGINFSALPNADLRVREAISILENGLTGGDSDRGDDMHWLLSNLKWQIVMDITAAKLHNVNLRRTFIDFLASECGDAFRRGIDEAKYIAAATTRGANIPESVFVRKELPIIGSMLSPQYQVATQYLATTSIPTHEGLKELLTKESTASFTKALPFVTSDRFKQLNLLESIRCDQLLYIIVQGFRWEAGHIYYQMLTGLPAGVSPATMLYTLFYGWPIHDFGGDNFFDLDFLVGGFSIDTLLNKAAQYTPEAQADFFTDLILVHLVRNEFAIAPTPYDVRRAGGAEAVNFADEYQRTVGSRSKFGEVYTWALLIPYVQGVLLYLLAVGYPFCCMLILVPGWHKIIFTWMTFWLWVKLWDAGFAVVVVLERSIWAMIGSRSDAVKLFGRVWGMQDHGRVTVECPADFMLFSATPPYGLCKPGVLPHVSVAPGGINLGPISLPVPGDDYLSWYDTMNILDQAMTIGAAIDLDLSNSYYIYIMAALYFAVPAVTGQLVLGAKAGAASLATQAIAGTAQEAGRGVGSAYTGSEHGRLNVMKEQAMQSANLAGQRESGFATGALQYGNQGLMARQEQAAAQTRAQALGQQSRVAGLSAQSATEALGVASSNVTAAAYQAQGFAQAGSQGLSGNTLRNERQRVGANDRARGNNEPSVVNPDPNGLPPTASGNAPYQQPRGAGMFADLGADAFSIVSSQAAGVAQRASFNNAAGSYAINEANRANQAAFDSQQSGQNVLGWHYGAESAGADMSASRFNEAAQFAGQSRAGALGAQMAQSLGGIASARGIIGGQFGSPLPTHGAAASGALGREAQDAWGFSSNGGYSNWMYGLGSDLNANYGASTTLGMYNSSQGQMGTIYAAAAEYGNTLSSNMGLNPVGAQNPTNPVTFGGNMTSVFTGGVGQIPNADNAGVPTSDALVGRSSGPSPAPAVPVRFQGGI